MLPAQNIVHKNIYVVSRQKPDTLTGDLIALNKVYELQIRGGKYSIEVSVYYDGILGNGRNTCFGPLKGDRTLVYINI